MMLARPTAFLQQRRLAPAPAPARRLAVNVRALPDGDDKSKVRALGRSSPGLPTTTS